MYLILVWVGLSFSVLMGDGLLVFEVVVKINGVVVKYRVVIWSERR